MAKYKDVCEHGVHYGGENCWVCHPEKLSSSFWLFSPEMDAASAAYKSAQQPAEPDASSGGASAGVNSIGEGQGAG
jgi:hypothetical protein